MVRDPAGVAEIQHRVRISFAEGRRHRGFIPLVCWVGGGTQSHRAPFLHNQRKAGEGNVTRPVVVDTKVLLHNLDLLCSSSSSQYDHDEESEVGGGRKKGKKKKVRCVIFFPDRYHVNTQQKTSASGWDTPNEKNDATCRCLRRSSAERERRGGNAPHRRCQVSGSGKHSKRTTVVRTVLRIWTMAAAT